MSARPAVFLDRDGTLVHDPGYLARLEDLRWFPCAIDAIRLVNRAGFLVLVLTNQGGIGLGLVDESFVGQAHASMARDVETGGGRVDGWFYCPHHPRAEIESLRIACDCRKPQPGMVRQAQRRFDIDLPRSFMVGDKASDMALAANIGARGVLVRTGHAEAELAEQPGGVMPGATQIAPDLMAAVAWILLQSRDGRETEA
jgi:D-glycero-D-manno-heptose 1,7-bisphosphate phosphatase